MKMKRFEITVNRETIKFTNDYEEVKEIIKRIDTLWEVTENLCGNVYDYDKNTIIYEW